MNTYNYSINVVARHAGYRAEQIASGLGWEPSNAWSVGDGRVTPAGTQLPGTRKDTMCTFRFEHDDDLLTLSVNAVIDHLSARRGFVRELLSAGGTLGLNIGFNGKFNTALDLSAEVLQNLSDMGVGISVECFPDG